MPVEKVLIQQFLQLAEKFPLLDVRSPGEYAHAHIPGAYNLALFTDEERRITGTAYKQQSRQHAIKTGLKYFGVKMVDVIEQVEALTAANEHKTVLVHCWRGGMRSAGVGWLLDLYGFKVYTLTGGYKTFRNWVLQQFKHDYAFKVLGGFTGSGKTEVLKTLQEKGELIIDLEALANHKGSAFGSLGQAKQPSQEMFENKLAIALASTRNYGKVIWLEDESQRIGSVNIPTELYHTIKTKPVYFLNISFEERLKIIVDAYGKFDTQQLENSIERIKKRLGGLETKTALQLLHENNITGCFRILLAYYDKWYKKSLQQKEHLVEIIKKIDCKNVNGDNNSEIILQESKGLVVYDK